MRYGFVSRATDPATDHATHNWEEWHAYLSAEVPEGLSLDAAGICCHDCRLVILDQEEECAA